MSHLPLLFSLLPFLIFLCLLLWKKTSILFASFVTFMVMLAISLFYWQIIPGYVFASFSKAILIALDIFVIIFGAIFFLSFLQKIGTIDHICLYLESYSKDYRLQVIILAWFFEAFLEGTAGFGTPAAVVAPLIIGLGLSPLTAVTVSLLGNSTPGIFGAAGTPIRVGFAGLDISSVPLFAATLNLLGFLVPVFILWILVSPHHDRRTQFFEALPFAVWSGLAFVIPSLLFTLLGQEFPSILGSIVGVVLVYFTTRWHLFLPPVIRSSPRVNIIRTQHLFQVIFPYLFLIILLFVGKYFLGSVQIHLSEGIVHTFNLYNPGLAFIIAGLVTSAIHRRADFSLWTIIKSSLTKALEPFLVIAFMSSVVQLMLFSGHNLSGIPAALHVLAANFANSLLPFLAPFVGAFGAFMTGSVTLSNLMFGNIISTIAPVVGFNPAWILALLAVGGAAGNMVALADILAAETVVGLRNHERHILRNVIIPCLVYIGLTGVFGLIFADFF